ncbi:unnamed protein product [Caretta caretta]
MVTMNMSLIRTNMPAYRRRGWFFVSYHQVIQKGHRDMNLKEVPCKAVKRKQRKKRGHNAESRQKLKKNTSHNKI